jgi:hypothetical protein
VTRRDILLALRVPEHVLLVDLWLEGRYNRSKYFEVLWYEALIPLLQRIQKSIIKDDRLLPLLFKEKDGGVDDESSRTDPMEQE